jgi:hypothetical protein
MWFRLNKISYYYEGEADCYGYPHGQGTLTSECGRRIFCGQWNHGTMHGYGTVRTPQMYAIGWWYHGKQTCYGYRKYFDDESEYTGFFENGEFDGPGTYIAFNGDIESGIFDRGLLNDSIPDPHNEYKKSRRQPPRKCAIRQYV